MADFKEIERLTGEVRPKGMVVWITGLSGSGKTTLAFALEKKMIESVAGMTARVLDGDLLRNSLCSDLGYSDSDRSENIRRAGEVVKLFVDVSISVVAAFISPFRKDRDSVRNSLPPGRFVEVYLDCPLKVCEKRDVKGLYKKARDGKIANFTGISSSYEPPLNPEVRLRTDLRTVESCALEVMRYLKKSEVFLELETIANVR